ncbi:hypothetical protein BDW69DRAFT_199032 [Aspergillus filifer]
MSTSSNSNTQLEFYCKNKNANYVPLGLNLDFCPRISVGDGVNFLSVGDYVVIPDRIDTGHLLMEPETYTACRAPGLPGSQARSVRVPFADHGLIPVPNPDDSTEPLLDYLFLSDIFPTAWTSLDYAGSGPGDTVAIFGAGPVGLLTAYSAMLRGASRVYAVDSVPSRLELAASIGAMLISFNTSDPVQQILEYEPNGVRRSVDCVRYEAVNATFSPDVSIVLRNMVEVTSVNGGLGLAGVYPSIYSPTTGNGKQDVFPVSSTLGAVNPMDIAPRLQDLIATGVARPSLIVSSEIRIEEVPEAHARFYEQSENQGGPSFSLSQGSRSRGV